MIKLLLLKTLVADMLANKDTIRYSKLCHFLTKKQSRLILECINSATEGELEMFITTDNTVIENKMKRILM